MMETISILILLPLLQEDFLNIRLDHSLIKLATGSFEYIDTRYFKSDGIGQSLPKIEIKSKYVKTSRAVLDNVHLILRQQKIIFQ